MDKNTTNDAAPLAGRADVQNEISAADSTLIAPNTTPSGDAPNAATPPAPRRPDIVRPGLFVARGVMGIVLPYVHLEPGKGPKIEHRIIAQSDKGQRTRLPFTPALSLEESGACSIYFATNPVRSGVVDLAEPWSEAAQDAWLAGRTPDPKDVYERVRALVDAHAWFPEGIRQEAVAVLSLWIMMTYLVPILDAVPYLHIQGNRNCGKTSVMRLLESLVYKPLGTSNATGAALFRSLEEGCTLLLDEAESLKEPGEPYTQIRQILNCGYRRGSGVSRCTGESHEVRRFDVFGPKALAGINTLPGTLASRCILIPMSRRPEHLQPRTVVGGDAAAVRDELFGLLLAVGLTLRDRLRKVLPTTNLSNRDADIWHPVLFLADWLEEQGVEGLGGLARSASSIFGCLDGEDDEPEIAHARAVLTELLERVRSGRGNCTAGDLVPAMIAKDPMFPAANPLAMANLLRRYGVPTRKSNGSKTYSWVRPALLEKVLAGLDPKPPPQGKTLDTREAMPDPQGS